MKSLECSICYDSIFAQNEIIPCFKCKKRICYKCFSSFITKFDNILTQYKCPYCRCTPSLSKISKMLNQLNKTHNIKDNLNISWNKINFNVNNNNNTLIVEIQDIPNNIDNIKNDILSIIKDYLRSKRLI